jgi:hypothetical protein
LRQSTFESSTWYDTYDYDHDDYDDDYDDYDEYDDYDDTYDSTSTYQYTSNMRKSTALTPITSNFRSVKKVGRIYGSNHAQVTTLTFLFSRVSY